jgi:hypothetical protein
MFDNYGSMRSPPVREYRISNVEPQKYFKIRYSLFGILRLIEMPGYFFTWKFSCVYQLRSGPFEGLATAKPPALPEDTYCVALGRTPRRTVEYACSVLPSRALWFLSFWPVCAASR